MREHKSISIADQIFEQLEHDILIGKYQRGEILTELKLCQSLGVSRTPIREALRRLEQEHIIEETSRGAVVIGISREDLFDMYEIRMHVEGLAAARTAEKISDEGLAKMKEVLDQLDPANFWQVHYSYIINRHYVREFRRNEFEMENGAVIGVSKKYKQEILQKLLEIKGQ